MEKQTPLYSEHVNSRARLVSFAGFTMPIQYSGIVEEHRAVRHAMGMFDLSHMGELEVRGPEAVTQVDQLVTNDIVGMHAGQVRYTPMCYPDGGIVDDLLVYRFDDHLLLVVNASNIQKDHDWVLEHVDGSTVVQDVSERTALIAVQGPRSESLLERLSSVNLNKIAYYSFVIGRVADKEALISRTGYTGEDGFELYVAAQDASHVWQQIYAEGAEKGLRLAGLGARDTLRLEAGYMLYGSDIDESTSPLEAGLGWTVKYGESQFIGREALEQKRSEGVTRRMVAIEMVDRAIARPHQRINVDGVQVGELTSGTFSPTFGRGIGLGYIRRELAKSGTAIDVEVRNQSHPARVVRKPMYKRKGA